MATKQKEPKLVNGIGRRLKELGKTQHWLALQIGMSDQSISNYVNRKIILSSIDYKTKIIMKVLDIDLDYLRSLNYE